MLCTSPAIFRHSPRLPASAFSPPTPMLSAESATCKTAPLPEHAPIPSTKASHLDQAHPTLGMWLDNPLPHACNIHEHHCQSHILPAIMKESLQRS